MATSSSDELESLVWLVSLLWSVPSVGGGPPAPPGPPGPPFGIALANTLFSSLAWSLVSAPLSTCDWIRSLIFDCISSGDGGLPPPAGRWPFIAVSMASRAALSASLSAELILARRHFGRELVLQHIDGATLCCVMGFDEADEIDVTLVSDGSVWITVFTCAKIGGAP